jgi:hypothetical protein
VGRSIQCLEKSGKHERRILMVATAADDSSSGSFDPLVQQARKTGVVVYAIGLTGGESRRDAQQARRALRPLTEASGGKGFYPKNLDEVEDATAQIAREIRGDSRK